MIGQLGHVMVGLADSIMIGKIGTIPLASSAFANSIFVVPMVFGLGMAYGMTTPIANADGEGGSKRSGSYLKHGLALNVLTASVIFIILMIASQFTSYMGQAPGVLETSSNYLMIISSSIFPLMIYMSFKQFAEGLSDTRFAMLASLGANLINVFLNYLLIYGNWGFPELGLDGAGYATLTARIIMAVIMFLYVFRTPKFKSHIQGFTNLPWKRAHFKKITDVGLPSGFQYIFEVSAFALAAIMVGQISAKSLAAHQIAISLASLSYMAATGIAAAATVRVGNQLGKKDFKALRLAGHTCLQMSLAFMFFCGLLFLLGRNFFPQFYTTDTEVMQIASQLLIVATIFQLSDGAQVVMLGALRGMSDTRIPTLITFVSYWLLGLASAYLMGITLDMGALGVWYGLALGLTAAAILLFWRFELKSKRLQLDA